mgnify:CR=1
LAYCALNFDDKIGRPTVTIDGERLCAFSRASWSTYWSSRDWSTYWSSREAVQGTLVTAEPFTAFKDGACLIENQVAGRIVMI